MLSERLNSRARGTYLSEADYGEHQAQIRLLEGTARMEVSQYFSVVVGVIAALASITSALVATRSAGKSRDAQREIESRKLLEARVAATKTEVYKPMVQALNDIFLNDETRLPAGGRNRQSQLKPKPTLAQITHEFAPWLTIVGSDEAVMAFRNLMQAAFNDAPPQIYLRLYAEFFVAARRDMGDPDTVISSEHVLGMRITDLYKGADFLRIGTSSLQQIAKEYNWSIPWSRREADLPATVPSEATETD